MQSTSLKFDPDMEFPSNFKDIINNSTALANDLQPNQSDTQQFMILQMLNGETQLTDENLLSWAISDVSPSEIGIYLKF